uniref:Uncharacterized protein n=1 Tax=Oryza punctata TaxID=4537 RepID=A0A0E0L8G9_ORYPU
MDATFGMEWTAAELGEARSVVTRVSNDYNAGVGSSNGNGAGDTKHDRIVRELQATFPSRTMVQVIDLYIDLAVEMVQAAAAQPQDAGVGSSVNNNDVVDAGMVFGGAPMEGAVEQAPLAPVAVNGGDGEVVNQDNDDDDEFWTDYEHRLFLNGMRAYGRGDWRNISRYFVRSKTPEQVSVYAENYFHIMEIAAAMDDNDDDHENNNNNLGGGGQLPAIVGVAHGPAAGHIAPATSSNAATAAANNNVVAPFWAPLLYNPEIEQRMMEMQAQSQQAWDDQQMKMAAAATPKEGAADK